ncbi:hypothetical protein Maes01_00092 [Microbulbifer aestuariivivens]|uniref:Type II secretion system protein GspC N-terminal domain-containing protein n=2 Tax=Microbulbifer aestuariivivens TaxID=1908308 RepID=A0ABP9WKC8_9GAMM
MSALQRLIQALPSGAAGRPLSRSLGASASVLGAWLTINVLAYGGSIFPSSAEESLGNSLIVQRDPAAVPSRGDASLPDTPFFGVAAVEPVEEPPALDLANIPITQLNLVLSGVLDSSNENRASALVAERGKPAQRLFVGERLPGGAELYSVATDHIILQRNGKMEKLTYPDADGRPSVPVNRFSTGGLSNGGLNNRGIGSGLTLREQIEAFSAGNREEPVASEQSMQERLEFMRSIARERRGED